MKKNHLINMEIPIAYLQMVSHEYKNFQKNPCTHFFKYVWTKSCPKTGDRQTDLQAESNKHPPPQTLLARGIQMSCPLSS